MTLLLIIAAAVFIFWAMGKGYFSLDGAQVSQLVRQMGGFALLGTGITLATTGKILFAVPALLGGLWLMGYLKVPGFKNWGSVNVMRRATTLLDIRIDQQTGAIEGAVTGGALKGRALRSLSQQECYRLLEELNAGDPNGLRLFVAYLDGRFPGWREDLQGGANAGPGSQARTGVMSDKEAYHILGLGPGADQTAIRDAHRRLIQKLHPDVGGSNALAALVNEAKDVLLGRHR
jgi:hypothetical protein